MENTYPEHVLVCVADPSSCRELILAGATLAEKRQLPVKVIHVQPTGLVSPKNAETLQALYNISAKLGAETTVYFSDDAALSVAIHARKTNAIHLVCGAPGANSRLFLEALRGLLPALPLSVLDKEGHIVTFPGTTAARHPSPQERKTS